LSTYVSSLLGLLKSWWSSPYKFPRSMLGAGVSLLAGPQLLLVLVYLCFGELREDEDNVLLSLLRSAIEQDGWIAILGSSLCLLSIPVFLIVHAKQAAAKSAGHAFHIVLEFPDLHALSDSEGGHFNQEENKSRLEAVSALNRFAVVLSDDGDLPESFVKLHGQDYLTLYDQLMSPIDLQVTTASREPKLGRELLIPEVHATAESLKEALRHDQ
jgi:hypothetical protein